ncbi:MAG: alpha/beta fold hydrolase [Paracoccaceae bacterium]
MRALASLALAALLPACSVAGGPAAAVVGERPRAVSAAPADPRAETLRLPTADDAISVPASVWRAAEPRAVALALHGFGDYGPLTYAEAARAWASGGITVYAPDQRGFGRGETHGQWPGASALIADARTYVRAVRARHPGVPLVLIGHSMGGGVALAAAGRGADIDALVLAAPAIWGGARLSAFQRALAWTAALVAPDRRLTGEGVIEIQASDNLAALRRLGADPYYIGAPSPRELLGLVRGLDAAEAVAPAVDVPALLLLGERDEIVPAGKARAVFARLSGETTAIAYPEGWHLLFRDRQAARVWADVGTWMLALAAETREAAAPR